MASDSENDTRSCEDFQEKLPDLMQAREELYRDPHLKTCERCRALLIELEQIADAARRFKRYN